MSVEAFRDDLTARLRNYAWDQWAQIGVSGSVPPRPERRAADPEALILFTLEVGRHDPRLFDEVLDWLVLNESLISVQRLRNLCRDSDDRALVDGALGCVARWRPRARLTRKGRDDGVAPQAKRLFYGLSLPHGDPEPSFARAGLLRQPFEPSRKSRTPDYAAAINLAFRLRRFLGIGARAEVTRVLLTADAPRVTTGVVDASAGFARPNVREALAQLRDAGVAEMVGVGSNTFCTVRREDWATFLRIDGGLPRHQDSIQTLGPLRSVLRWLHDERTESLSDYMRASEARVLAEQIEPELRYAGFMIEAGALGTDFWDSFIATIESVAASLYYG